MAHVSQVAVIDASEGPIEGLAFSADGSFLAVAQGGAIRVYWIRMSPGEALRLAAEGRASDGKSATPAAPGVPRP